MQRLERAQFALAQPLFTELAANHFSIDAVLTGTAPGEVYVDDLNEPRIGLAFTPEGEYLVGNVDDSRVYPALKELIPPRAYLTFHPAEWEAKLPEIWVNRAARRHPRYHLRLAASRIGHWRDLVPAGVRVIKIDHAFLEQRELVHHDVVRVRVEGWHSTEYFLEHGFGFCALVGDTIASCCVADCVIDEKCELGIFTDIEYRQRGLATLVVAAAVEDCLARGITTLGWHCLQSNMGSIAVAEKIGFQKDLNYFAYSSVLPTENATDMSVADYQEWAHHYEQFIPDHYTYGYDAARAWSLAGNAERALMHLHQLLAQGWRGRPEWLAHNWVFASLRGLPEFEEIIALLTQEADNAV